MAKRIIDETLIFNAALNEFTSKSYEDASINTIIKNADISKGSFYYRFENKYVLYLYLIKKCSEKKWEFIKYAMETEKKPMDSLDIFSQFLNMSEIGIRFAQAYPQYFLLNKRFSREKGTKVYKDILHNLNSSDDSEIELLIDEAYKRGEFNNRFSKKFITAVISQLFSSFDEIFFKDEEYDLKKAITNLKDYVEFMRYGLSASKC